MGATGVGLLEHQRKKHSRKLNTKGRREEVTVHKCDHCNATFRFKESLKIHCQNVHPQGGDIIKLFFICH
jgi:hypothetical protein